jgi:hypothetical protein
MAIYLLNGNIFIAAEGVQYYGHILLNITARDGFEEEVWTKEKMASEKEWKDEKEEIKLCAWELEKVVLIGLTE